MVNIPILTYVIMKKQAFTSLMKIEFINMDFILHCLKLTIIILVKYNTLNILNMWGENFEKNNGCLFHIGIIFTNFCLCG